jgi:hypothetical protein
MTRSRVRVIPPHQLGHSDGDTTPAMLGCFPQRGQDRKVVRVRVGLGGGDSP